MSDLENIVVTAVAGILFLVLVGIFFQLGQIRKTICNGMSRQINKNTRNITKILHHLRLESVPDEPVDAHIDNM